VDSSHTVQEQSGAGWSEPRRGPELVLLPRQFAKRARPAQGGVGAAHQASRVEVIHSLTPMVVVLRQTGMVACHSLLG
jgi:hypothetical protein